VLRRVKSKVWSSSVAFATAIALSSPFLIACSAPQSPDVVVGTFTMFNRESSYLIAAPHGEFDENTNEITYDFCERVRWDCLVAEGFRRGPARINVNRPTAGTQLAEARFTDSAALVYTKYVRRIRRLSPRVIFYVEIHGHRRSSLGDTIDVATIGVSPSQAQFIQQEFRRGLAERGMGHFNVRLDVLESIRYKATHARRFGVLSFLSPALHIELPPSARRQHRREVVDTLVEVLPLIAHQAFPFQYLEPR